MMKYERILKEEKVFLRVDRNVICKGHIWCASRAHDLGDEAERDTRGFTYVCIRLYFGR